MQRNKKICGLTFVISASFILLGLWHSELAAQEFSISQRLEFPSSLHKDIQQLNIKRLPDPEQDETRRKEMVKEVYQWMYQSLSSSFSGDDILSASLPLFPGNTAPETSTWKQRLAFQAEHSDLPMVFHTLSWTSDRYELLVAQIDYVSYMLQSTGYLTGTPPHIYLKTEKMVIEADLATWKYAGIGSITYTIHGLIHATDQQICPDVLLSTGPVGSGNFVYFVQMHYDEFAQCWKPVWHIDHAYMMDVDYIEKENMLTINYLIDRETGKTEQSSYPLTWGGEILQHGANAGNQICP